jgi:hypothetical protein
MDHRLDLGVSKAGSGVNKVVWEVSREVRGRGDKVSERSLIS